MKEVLKNKKSFLGVIFSAALTVLCLSILCSCGKDEPDLSGISEIPGTFLEAVKNLDRYTAFECSPEFDSSEWDELNEDQKHIMQSIMSYAEITEMGDPVFYEETGCADLDVTVSYISMDDIVDAGISRYVSETKLSEVLEECDERSEKSITLDFEYNDADACWNLTKSSARKICKLFSFDLAQLFEIVDISPDECKDIVMSYLEGIAACTDADSFPDEFDLESYRFYDDSLLGGEGSLTEDAVARFAAAYAEYILSHDPYVARTDAYVGHLDMQVPSSTDLQNALYSEEYNRNFFINLVRYMYSDMDIEELSDIQTALIYDTIADAIPDCGSEDYWAIFEVSPSKDSEVPCTFDRDIITGPANNEITIPITMEDVYRYFEEAINYLHDNGEADDELYEKMLENIPDLDACFTFEADVSRSGHPNQAVDTYMYVPSWCTDGSLFYGESETDDQGFRMLYSGQPEWGVLAGYYIDDEGIWISNYFEHLFFPTDEVIVCWWVDGEVMVDTQIVLVDAFTNEIEVFLPVDELPESGTYEMRIWETDHSHVIAYVTIER